MHLENRIKIIKAECNEYKNKLRSCEKHSTKVIILQYSNSKEPKRTHSGQATKGARGMPWH